MWTRLVEECGGRRHVFVWRELLTRGPQSVMTDEKGCHFLLFILDIGLLGTIHGIEKPKVIKGIILEGFAFAKDKHTRVTWDWQSCERFKGGRGA